MGDRFKFEGSVKRDIQSPQRGTDQNASGKKSSSNSKRHRYQRPENVYDAEDDPKLQATLIRERRAMLIITAISVVCIFLFLIAVATNYWLWAQFRHKLPDTDTNITTQLWIGIWNEYRLRTFDNGTHIENRIAHFPTPPEGVIRLDDIDLKHYYRTQAVFSIISLLIMIAGVGCAIYSMKERRYMYKRLTAGLHAFSAMSVLVVIEVMVHHVSEWKISTRDLRTEYGFSTIVSWIVFIVYIVDVVVFIVCSRKRKGSRAGTLEYDPEDRPMELGR